MAVSNLVGTEQGFGYPGSAHQLFHDVLNFAVQFKSVVGDTGRLNTLLHIHNHCECLKRRPCGLDSLSWASKP